jgi:hypothetical protein
VHYTHEKNQNNTYKRVFFTENPKKYSSHTFCKVRFSKKNRHLFSNLEAFGALLLFNAVKSAILTRMLHGKIVRNMFSKDNLSKMRKREVRLRLRLSRNRPFHDKRFKCFHFALRVKNKYISELTIDKFNSNNK